MRRLDTLGSGFTGFAVLVTVVAGLGAALPTGAQAQQTLTCRFMQGPRAGATIDFTGAPLATPGPIGTPCADGLGSSGVFVAAGGGSNTPLLPPGMTWKCQFTQGLRAGQMIDFQYVPGAQPGFINGPCFDGAGSVGFMIP